MAIAIRQYKTADSTSARASSPLVLAFDSDVLAGSVLVVIGVGLDNTVYTFSNLSSVTDSRSNTWQSAVNQNRSGTAACWFSYAMNAAAGATTVTANLSVATENRYGIAIFEVTGALTAAALDMTAVGTSGDGVTSGTTVETAATGALDQANNVVFLVAGGAITPSNPAGYTSYLNVANGGTKIGTQISAKITAATTTITGSVTHTATTVYRHALLAVIKEAAAGTGYEYKFQFNSTDFTSGDTAIAGYVWRNGTPDTVLAETYTGLAGDAVAGDLIVPNASIPTAVASTDTVVGIFYNGTDTSGLVSGTVQAA